jgi:16S rRNA (uracil1498-N3)-methyltransferase
VRLIRVHVDAPLAVGARVKLGKAAAAHVIRVLRLGAGGAVTLFNGDGYDYAARLVAAGRGSVEAVVGGLAAARAESPLAVTLVQGIARAEKMDLVVQKATELGVAAILPVATARSVVKVDAKGRDRKAAHWRGVAIGACEQCGRARVPAVGEPQAFAAWLAAPPAAPLRMLLAPEAPAPLATAAAGASAVELLVGPEGGLEDAECRAALAAGFIACRLGPRVLRSETAAIAAMAVLQSVCGDLG